MIHQKMVGVERRDEDTSSLITDYSSSSSSSSADPSHNRPLKRTGTLWTAIAHIINGVIGTAVLSLAWSVAQLGWIAGPICMLVFGIITIISSNLLCDCYRYPNPEVGHIRNRSFAEAVRCYLGKRSSRVAAIFIQEIYYGCGVAFTITSAISMREILKSNCYHKEGPNAPCEYADGLFMLLFGAVQVLFSQIPDLHNMELLSIIAAIMSFGYTLIGPILAFAKVVRDGEIKGGISGVSTANLAQKLLLSSQAIGDIAFAFTYNAVLLDIQDTLKAPPPENRTMKKASITALLITTTLFIFCGCFGYAAFGNQSPGNLLTGFYEPYWLVNIANLCIVLHLLGAYQINAQPLFAVVERWISKKHPNSRFVNKEHRIKLPLLCSFKLNLLRLCFRTAYVASTTGLAILFPYFNQVLGVMGAVNFWPIAIYFPVEMYIAQNNLRVWTGAWILLQAFKILCLLCTIFALVGSLEGIISNRLS